MLSPRKETAFRDHPYTLIFLEFDQRRPRSDATRDNFQF